MQHDQRHLLFVAKYEESEKNMKTLKTRQTSLNVHCKKKLINPFWLPQFHTHFHMIGQFH